MEGSGSSVGISVVSSEQVIQAEATRNVLEKQLIRWAKRGDTTPSVLNVERLQFRNTVSTLVTKFDDGKPGQQIYVLGDGFTTIQNGAKIINANAADRLLGAGEVHTYTMWEDRIWREHFGSSGGGGGGAGVTSFAGRTGVVLPATGDYTAAQVGATPASHLTDSDPHPQYVLDTEKAVASGIPTLGLDALVPTGQLGTGTADATKFLRGDKTWVAPGVGPVARAYWMVIIARTQGGSLPRVGEIKLHTTIGGANVAVGGTPIFINQNTTSGDNSAAAAFDGNSATAWAGVDSVFPNGIGYLCPSPQAVIEVIITARNDSFGPGGAPIVGAIMSSADGVNWVREWDFLSPATWTAGLSRTFTRPS
jgi:hypothetical protein